MVFGMVEFWAGNYGSAGFDKCRSRGSAFCGIGRQHEWFGNNGCKELFDGAEVFLASAATVKVMNSSGTEVETQPRSVYGQNRNGLGLDSYIERYLASGAWFFEKYHVKRRQPLCGGKPFNSC